MSEVLRLPPEPRIGTVVRPVEPMLPELAAVKYQRNQKGWARCDQPSHMVTSWDYLLALHTEGLEVVPAGPHPTPWHVTFANLGRGKEVVIVDANAIVVVDRFDNDAIPKRIVDAVNKAEQP